jgi:hypothetical protein
MRDKTKFTGANLVIKALFRIRNRRSSDRTQESGVRRNAELEECGIGVVRYWGDGARRRDGRPGYFCAHFRWFGRSTFLLFMRFFSKRVPTERHSGERPRVHHRPISADRGSRLLQDVVHAIARERRPAHRRKCHFGCLGTDLVSQGFASISAWPAERAEALKCLSGQLQGKLTCRKLSTERRSFSGV